MSGVQSGSLPFALGVYVGNPNISSSSQEATFQASLNDYSALMGALPQYLNQFGDPTLPISQWVSQARWDAASTALTPGLIPVIALPMTSTAAGSLTPDQYYQNFAAGDYDTVLKGMVQAWAGAGFTTQIWRPGWEMNLNSPSYAGNDAATRADWVAAFQHIYTVLHAAGQADGVKVQVMWNPSVTNYSNAGNVIQTAYPGNQYVDLIGADVYGDVYPYGSTTQLYDWDHSGQVLNSNHPIYDTSLQQWASDTVNLEHYYTNPSSTQWALDSSSGHATSLQQLIDLAKSTGKPFAIAETGAGTTCDSAGLADNPTFVKWLAQTLQQSGVSVMFVSIWDSNGGGSYEFSKASDAKPLEAAAWGKYFGATAALAVPTVTSFLPDSNVGGDGITNVNHLLLSGTAAAGNTVHVFDGATQLGMVIADGSGAWSFATAMLAEGNHGFTSKAMDDAGNVSAASAALNVTIDITAPSAPTLISYSNATPTSVTVAGTAEVGSMIHLFEGSTLLGTALAGLSGTWHVTTGPLSGGSYEFAATAIDAAGNASQLSNILDTIISDKSPGVNIFHVNSASDAIIQAPNDRNDIEISSVSNAIAPNVGTLKLEDGMLNAISAVSTSGNHTLIGNEFNNTLVSQHGVGISIGGQGNDTYVVDNSADVIVELPGEGYDVEYSSVSNTVAPNVERMVLTESAISAVATYGNHTLVGNSMNNVFVAENGNDTLIGGSGNNTFVVDNNQDQIIVQPNQSYNTVFSSVSFHIPDNVQELHLSEGATNAVVALGNSGNNFIYGNSGDNVLNGLGGSDTFYGLGGNDVFQFSQTNFGHQTIMDFDPTRDNLSFSKSIFSDYNTMKDHLAQSGSDVLILYDGPNNYVTLHNVQVASLHASDFSFF